MTEASSYQVLLLLVNFPFFLSLYSFHSLFFIETRKEKNMRVREPDQSCCKNLCQGWLNVGPYDIQPYRHYTTLSKRCHCKVAGHSNFPATIFYFSKRGWNDLFKQE